MIEFRVPVQSDPGMDDVNVGGQSAGTFAVSDLPNNDAVLFLVIHRHDTVSTSVSFESHVFSNLANAQIVVLDTYKGSEKAHTNIMDAGSKINKEKARSEELRFDSVVAVNPGRYTVGLTGEDGVSQAKSDLVALSKESYVVLRVGVEAQQGPKYPQEIVVFPQSDPAMLPSSAAQVSMTLVAGMLIAALW